MTDFILRPATQTDAPQIRALINRVGINPLGLDWKRFIVSETNDGKFTGCGQLKPHKDGSLELASIAVDAPYRGQGVARRIIEHLLQVSPRPLYLMCRSELGPFYARFGFRVIGADEMTSYYRRIRGLVRILGVLLRRARKGGPLIMRLDEERC